MIESRRWSSLASVSAERLWEARMQAHYGLQVPAALHASRYPPRVDQSQTAFVVEGAGFVSEGDASVPWRASFDPATLRVGLHPENGAAAASFALDGLSLEEAYGRFAALLDTHLGPEPFVRLEAELPEHALARGATFVRDTEALKALAALYQDASALLRDLRPALVNPSPLRVWPHHFDLAVLDDLDADTTLPAEERRSIGVGMTPGDEGITEPYLYVTPWPYPAATDLPDLPEGAWAREGWVGAVLPLRELAGAPDETRTSRVEAFVDAAVSASRALLAARHER